MNASNRRHVAHRVSRTSPAALVAALVGLLGVGSCDQPKTECITAHGQFAARYTLLEGTGPCAELKGGAVGVESYLRGAPGERPDYSLPPVALQPAEVSGPLADYEAERPASEVTAQGAFTQQRPGDDLFCPVGTMTAINLSLAAKPAGMDAMGMPTPALPATEIKVAYGDVKFVVSAALIGTAMSGTFTYTKDACTAKYRFAALNPLFSCKGKDGKPDETMCSPCPDPARGRPSGSSIGPDYDVVCDPDLLLCVLRNDAPSLLPSPVKCADPAPFTPPAEEPDAAAPTPDADTPDAGATGADAALADAAGPDGIGGV